MLNCGIKTYTFSLHRLSIECKQLINEYNRRQHGTFYKKSYLALAFHVTFCLLLCVFQGKWKQTWMRHDAVRAMAFQRERFTTFSKTNESGSF